VVGGGGGGPPAGYIWVHFEIGCEVFGIMAAFV
jgi:hypothetical protein